MSERVNLLCHTVNGRLTFGGSSYTRNPEILTETSCRQSALLALSSDFYLTLNTEAVKEGKSKAIPVTGRGGP
jgi:hypothetical protein